MLTERGSEQSTADYCLLIIKKEAKSRSFVSIQVDDTIIASTANKNANKLLRRKFDMGSMEDVHNFLGMKII